MYYTSLTTTLAKYDRKDILTIYFISGLVFKCFVETMCDTDNCLDMEDINYFEYYMAVVEIVEIIKLPILEKGNLTFRAIEVGNLVEISVVNEPLKIEFNDKVIWK